MLQRRLPDMAAQRYVKYHLRYGMVPTVALARVLSCLARGCPVPGESVLECWDKKLAIEQLCVDPGSN